jgi:hypothetical protein
MLRCILTLVLAAAAATTVAPSATPAPLCSLVNDPPSLYADIVLTHGAVECDGSARRLRVYLELRRDGVVVNSARRDCRRANVCQITVDASVVDIPGDQVYCAHAVGYADGAFVGESTACESEGF